MLHLVRLWHVEVDTLQPGQSGFEYPVDQYPMPGEFISSGKRICLNTSLTDFQHNHDEIEPCITSEGWSIK